MRCVSKLEADIGQDCISVNVYLPDEGVCYQSNVQCRWKKSLDFGVSIPCLQNLS